MRTWLDRAEKLGANPAAVELNLCLVAWRDGDVEAAQRHFRRIERFDSKALESWNGAPVTTPIESLSDLMGHCCRDLACGPFLAARCEASQLAVAHRSVPAEVARQELTVEMERRRELDEIYSKRKDLEITVEKPEAVPAAP